MPPLSRLGSALVSERIIARWRDPGIVLDKSVLLVEAPEDWRSPRRWRAVQERWCVCDVSEVRSYLAGFLTAADGVLV